MIDQHNSHHTVQRIIQQGDTFHSLAKAYYHNADQWRMICQENLALQSHSPEEQLPVGHRLKLPSTGFQLPLQTRGHRKIHHHFIIGTGRHDTLRILAERYYGDGEEWPIISKANPDLKNYGPDQILPQGISVSIP